MEAGRFYSFKIKGWEQVLYGVVCKATTDWVLIKNIARDFLCDGFALIQTRYIKKCVNNETCYLREQILLAKGIMDMPYPDVSLEDLIAPLSWFLDQREVIFFTSRDETEGFMGKIMKVTKKKLQLYYIDPEGVWDSNYWNFSLNDLVVIEWQSDYIKSLIMYSNNIHEGKDA